jgi:hypothetical protein
MFVMKPGMKRDPKGRWALPDRIFFGHGACHILAGVCLRDAPLPGLYAERIIPDDGLPGNHIYVTNGQIAFDYHGYSKRMNLLEHHKRCWSRQHRGWRCKIEVVDFDLLDTAQLNRRKMLGPDQYHGDPTLRAGRFVARVDHQFASQKAARVPSRIEHAMDR